MRLRLIRHATLIVEIDRRRILADPMLDEVDTRPPIESTPNQVRNPTVRLPVPAEEVVAGSARCS